MGLSNSHLEFKQKYCDKKYTKNDLNNPTVFNIDEIDEDASFMGQWKIHYVELIKDCADVVKESPENMTMELKGDIDNSITYGLKMGVALENYDRKTIYNLKTSGDYVNDCVFMNINNERPYKFFHPSNVRIYFQSLWQRSKY